MFRRKFSTRMYDCNHSFFFFFFICIAPVAFCHLSIVRRLKLLTTLVPPQLKKIP
jgi:hypothetical protein